MPEFALAELVLGGPGSNEGRVRDGRISRHDGFVPLGWLIGLLGGRARRYPGRTPERFRHHSARPLGAGRRNRVQAGPGRRRCRRGRRRGSPARQRVAATQAPGHV